MTTRRIRQSLTILGTLLIGLAVPGTPALAAPGRSAQRAPLYYVALGTSLSVGFQPDASGQGQRTDEGYPDQLYGSLLATAPTLQLVKLGCPAETSVTMIAGGICAYAHGAQLDEAVAFLHAHRRFLALVTIDIGANDIEVCGSLTGIDQACVARAFADVAQNLPRILGALRAAAGPDVPIVAMNYYNPFVAAWLTGPAGQQLATESAVGLALFNALLAGLYGFASVPVADVAGAFHSADFSPDPDFPALPRNVVTVCAWTWMCVAPPVGPNIHANAAGYEAIAGAFLAVLP